MQLNTLDTYNAAQKINVWAGEDYEGTSVDAVLQIARKAGRIKEYRWTSDVEIMAAHIIETGPAIVGTEWWEHMAIPVKGRMEIGGRNLGGTLTSFPTSR